MERNWWEDAFNEDHKVSIEAIERNRRQKRGHVFKPVQKHIVFYGAEGLPLNPTPIRGKQLLEKGDTRIFI